MERVENRRASPDHSFFTVFFKFQPCVPAREAKSRKRERERKREDHSQTPAMSRKELKVKRSAKERSMLKAAGAKRIERSRCDTLGIEIR